jgi:AcrR family transcriptional regulator
VVTVDRGTKPKRRTQAERREATRTALLDAAVASLAEEGYANTTTRGIAARAGVTPGALQHHFPNKTELMAETRRHISTKIVHEAVSQGGDLAELPHLERAEELLDRMWRLYSGALLQAGMEIWVAARTDARLRAKLVDVQRFGGEWLAAAGPILFPEVADRDAITGLITTADATLRGLAVLRCVNDADAERAWPAARAHLLALGAPLRAEAGAPR